MKRRIGEGNELVAVLGHHIRKRDWIGNVRSPDQCFVPANFRLPPHSAEVKHRLFRNLQYFLSNYLMYGLIVLFYGIFRSAVALICVLCLCIMWYYVIQLKHIKIGDVILAEAYKLWAMAVLSLIVLLLCAGNVLLWILTFSMVPILLHASLHIPMAPMMNKKDDDLDPENPQVEEEEKVPEKSEVGASARRSSVRDREEPKDGERKDARLG
eukprot:CAMPEP_0184479006 /NCGR_PEP_ID=MMETSP0113_2-20130426/879_1 /TAXON_ID=91329 /ORGANISM="Norrisiella sphaerica, Strain BC52" /LENGTH=211 /DNA_ID=CAMNT_0026856981 /DNA_START=81 /DNA_END=716 /DNA_ORIENTATION=-